MSDVAYPISHNVEVLRAPVDTKNKGIRWGLSEQLEDLDYADDILMLSSQTSDIECKLNGLVEESTKVVLKMNSAKTKILKARTSNTSSIYI